MKVFIFDSFYQLKWDHTSRRNAEAQYGRASRFTVMPEISAPTPLSIMTDQGARPKPKGGVNRPLDHVRLTPCYDQRFYKVRLISTVYTLSLLRVG